MGSVSISTGRVSTAKGGAVQSSKGLRGRKEKKTVDIKANASKTVYRVLDTLINPKQTYRGRIVLKRRGRHKHAAFKHWVVSRIPRTGISSKQRDLIAWAAIAVLCKGGSEPMLRHWTGAKNDSYEVTEMGRRFLRDTGSNGVVTQEVSA